MSIGARLKDARGAHLATQPDEEGCSTLIVAAEDRHQLDFWQSRLKRTDNSTHEMAINATTAGGTSLNIWDGTGAGDTGSDWTRGGNATASESTSAAKNGTNGLDVTDWDDGERVTFDNGSSISLASYATLEFWWQSKASPNGLDVEIEWRDGGDGVGEKVKLQDYGSFPIDSWVHVSIPLSDFNLTGSVGTLRFKSKENNIAAWMDDIVLMQSSGPAVGPKVFRAGAGFDRIVDLHRLSLVFAAPESGWAYNDFATIDGGLSSGMVVRLRDDHTSEVFWTFQIKDNRELLGRFDVIQHVEFLNANILVKSVLNFNRTPVRLQRNIGIEVLIRDDLSSLTSMESWAVGGRRLR